MNGNPTVVEIHFGDNMFKKADITYMCTYKIEIFGDFVKYFNKDL